MNSSNLSSKARILQDDHLSSIRRRNKTLILVFFSLIILLALTIGGIIISLVHRHNSNSQSLNPSPAIREFCSPSLSKFSCIACLYSTIKTSPNTNLDEIFILSLQTAVTDLSAISSTAFNETRQPELALGNCSSSLSHAVSQLNNILGRMRVNPDVETHSYEQRGDMIAWIDVAMEDLASCESDLGKLEATAEDAVSRKVEEMASLVRYSKDFLVDCDIVSANFRLALEDEKISTDQIVEDLLEVSLFGSQYFVLVLLFCLLLRIY